MYLSLFQYKRHLMECKRLKQKRFKLHKVPSPQWNAKDGMRKGENAQVPLPSPPLPSHPLPSLECKR